jgi:hypothetical protein
MSDDAGYTLAEALTALMIVALAMTGLTQAVRLTTAQATTAARLHGRAADLAATQRLVNAFPQSEGPFDGVNQGLVGDARHIAFACGRGTCTMDLASVGTGSTLSAAGKGLARTVPLDRHARPAFRYVAADGAISGRWPDADRQARLAAIMLIDGDAVLAIRRFAVTVDLSCAATAARPCGSSQREVP